MLNHFVSTFCCEIGGAILFPHGLMTKKEVLLQGHWPKEFLEGLYEVPPLSISTKAVLTWNCPTHGPYSQTVGHHLRSPACPICNRAQAARNRVPLSTYTVKDLPDVDPAELSRLSQGVHKSDKVRFICPIHGVYVQSVSNYIKGCRCPSCRYQRMSKSLKETLSRRSQVEWDSITSKIKGSRLTNRGSLLGHYNVTDLSEVSPKYREGLDTISSTELIEFVCPIHGPYYQSVKDHFRQDGKQSHCPSCAAANSTYGSHIEQKLLKYLQSINLNCYKDRILIKPQELDIYIPDYHLAIEVNGAYYHSDNYLSSKGKDGKMYHKLKSQACLANGVQLLHFHAWELENKWDICINKIMSCCRLLKRVKVYGRCTKLVSPTVAEAREFYNLYHIQGWGNGVTYGLAVQGILVACMSFRKSPSNTSEAGSWELNRYATHSSYFVVGGFLKLLTAFLREYKPTRVVSYADLRLSKGDLYEHEGFVLESVSLPDYQVCDKHSGKPFHKFNFRVERFKRDPNLKYEEGLTEFELEDLNGLCRVWNCGLAKYVLHLIN